MGERRATDGGVEAVVKLSAARRMLEVMGDTGGQGGGRASSELASEMVSVAPSVSRGVGLGRTEIRALRRGGASFGDGFVGFGSVRATFGGFVCGCHGWGKWW